MFRSAMKELEKWKAKKRRKPLIIRGARQVGKTWLMKEFGATAYVHTVYINFDNNERMKTLFTGSFSVERIVTGLELYAGQKIDADNTLLIFDEVQEVPQALAALKYFNEDAPQYQIVCAGSLLGVALHPGTSFPVGKVEFLDLYPLSFFEFMIAMGKDQYVDLLQKGDFEMASAFKQDYIDLMKPYYYVGGMPEVVQAFADNRDFNEAREIQQRILSAYEQDFSKHAPNEVVPRIRMLWNSIPAQLAKENKKFIYGLIKEGARAKEYELAMLWLTDCGLVHKVHRVSTPSLPLKAYEDLKAFKLFLLDVGLLSCMVGLRQDVLLDGNELFKEFKGALTEQYVLQQLKTVRGLNIYYWTAERGTAEVDFVIDNGGDVTPVEVKAEVNLQAKSLKVYREKFQPRLSIRTSMADYKIEDWLLNLPLWAVEAMGKAADYK
ncbi:ATP-binding protein [Intestinimonas massiliensis]|uniref:ATP-binding protein n=1 Tax=Intestinimonas massiliensis (ex Afouda et al. 2020) TaxID=1673721 RepID=A0ABS9M792_9FIRM|nr:ATP-binding protein [Intestinimonas massiliensis (ex Afouda et al. 2020)]MCG4526665.1 ATP-binding protein [Intestinimonas massiliensis (ex Afouda et al. 2020)]MCQ4806448.1 ATP-binding protein [Intestinimonas massiliensis (ex Afouda et al. 2020)]